MKNTNPETSVDPPKLQKSFPFGRPPQGDSGEDLEKNRPNKSKSKNGPKKPFDIEEGSSRIDFITPESKKNENLTDK